VTLPIIKVLEKTPKEIKKKKKKAFLFAEPAALNTVSYEQEMVGYTLML